MENQQTTPVDSYNPLSEPVNEKSYAGGGATHTGPVQDIAEPIFTPPPLNPDAPEKEEHSSSRKAAAGKKESAPFNEEMNELSDPEKKKAAEQAATFAMSMYKGAWLWVNNSFVMITDKKINKLQMEGEIDLNVSVPYSENGNVRLGEFISEYNNQHKEALTVTEEFEEAVMPPLTRVLAKRGAGMTDENFLLFMVGQDIIQKGVLISTARRTVKDIIDFAKDQTASSRYTPPVPSAPVPVQQFQQQQAPVVTDTYYEPTTLQEKALQRVESGTHSEPDRQGMPQMGDPDKLKTMNQIYEEELKQKKRAESVRKKLGKGTTPQPKQRRKTGVPKASDGVKRGPGRPRKTQ